VAILRRFGFHFEGITFTKICSMLGSLDTKFNLFKDYNDKDSNDNIEVGIKRKREGGGVKVKEEPGSVSPLFTPRVADSSPDIVIGAPDSTAQGLQGGRVLRSRH